MEFTKEDEEKNCSLSTFRLGKSVKENMPLIEHVIQTLLKNKDIQIKSVCKKEKCPAIDVPEEHNCFLDVNAVDKKGTRYCIEFEKEDEDDLPQKAHAYAMQLIVKYGKENRRGLMEIPKVHVLFLIDNCLLPIDKLEDHYFYENGMTKEMAPYSPELHLFNMNYDGPMREFVEFFSEIRKMLAEEKK